MQLTLTQLAGEPDDHFPKRALANFLSRAFKIDHLNDLVQVLQAGGDKESLSRNLAIAKRLAEARSLSTGLRGLRPLHRTNKITAVRSISVT